MNLFANIVDIKNKEPVWQQETGLFTGRSIWLLITFLVSVGIYLYPKKVQSAILSFANYLTDIYLNFKYRNYQPKQIEQSNYKITKIYILSISNPLNIVELVINNKDLIGNTDLSQGCQTLKCSAIQKLINETGFNVDQLNDDKLIIIQYVYGSDSFYLPIKYQNDKEIKLPIYTVDDMDTCFKVQYESVSTLNVNSNEYMLNLINQFAGPKGNFYGDSIYPIKPEHIICPITQRKLIGDDQNDFIELLTAIGQHYKFNRGQDMKLD